MLTQKYKQQQQQVRVQTSESNYAKGMFFSDVPLTEGYSKVLINWDIDATTGKLVPRKGTHTTGLAQLNPMLFGENFSFKYGYNRIIQTKPYAALHATSESSQRSAVVKDHVIAVIYNTRSKHTCLVNIPLKSGVTPTAQYPYIAYTPIYDYSTEHMVRPYKLHGKYTSTHPFADKPIGCFLDNNYYTFLTPIEQKISATPTKLARVPSSKYPDVPYSRHLFTAYPIGNPGEYFTGEPYISGMAGDRINELDQPGRANDAVYYYDSQGVLQTYRNTSYIAEGYTSNEEAYLDKIAPTIYTFGTSKLCYAKLGKDLQPDDVLLNENLRANKGDTQFYMCEINPQKLNPTEAASWGYNMLLEDPYNFECEKTATNTITVLGILPYDNTGKVTLTPRKNQEITLKAYYRAPENFYTDVAKGTYYATTKQYIEVSTTDASGTVVTIKRDPKNASELPIDLTNYTFGNWWYCSEEKQYYMVVPGEDLLTKVLDEPSATKPAASVLLKPAMDATTASEIRVRWQMRTVDSSDWIDLYNETVLLNAQNNQPFVVTTTMSSDELLIKFTITDPASTNELTNEETVLTTNTIGLSLVSDDLATTLNLNPIKYDLGTCSGMCEWEQRLVLWGVHNALNTVFVSDVNNPTFFPYPNNIDTFPEPVLSVFNYGNELLVVTTSALYKLTWNTDGLGWTHTLIQRNLRIAPADIAECCVIKNMFFFKSGTQYYMLVPKANSTVQGETTIAPISKPIESLLNNFYIEIDNLLRILVDTDEQVLKTLVESYTSIDNNKVVIHYVYALNASVYSDTTESITDSAYITVQLMYDTDTRTWSLQFLETAHVPTAIQVDTTQRPRYLQLLYAKDNSNRAILLDTLAIAVTGYRGDSLVTDLYVPPIDDLSDSDVQYIKNEYPDQINTKEIIQHTHTVQNYQYLDTGNRDINTDMKKRFREFQFKIRNVNATNLGMHTSFLIDGSLRRDLQKFSPRYITDASTGEAVIVIERTLDNNPDYLSFVPEYKITRVERVIASTKMVQDAGELTPTTLAESTDPDYWVIDQSAFPGRTFWKIRVAISGKGYTPRAILLSTNLKSFEVLGHNWVYRTMHGR